MTYVSANFGLPLGSNGFVNTTFEIGSSAVSYTHLTLPTTD